jgi:hypothetical protein
MIGPTDMQKSLVTHETRLVNGTVGTEVVTVVGMTDQFDALT